MPVLEDFVATNVKNSSVRSSWILRFAYVLGIDTQKAQEVYENHGNDYIYARGGFAMPNTPHLWRKMLRTFGKVVLVTSDGSMEVHTRRGLIETIRKQAKIRAKVERRHERMERDEMRANRRTQHMFYDAQTRNCPKRSGKANSRGDIGKYVHIPEERISETKGATSIIITAKTRFITKRY